MIRIQALLIVMVALATGVYLARLRSSTAGRLTVLGLAAAGVALIVHPTAATRLARALGVGRGTDLILYLALVGLGFLMLMLFSRLRLMDQKLTQVTRELALATGGPAGRNEDTDD